MNKNEIYDLVIIGAGPAGSNLARLLHENFKVLIIDKRQLSEDNFEDEICCGGLLAPDAQKMLSTLGLGLPEHVLLGPQMFSVHTIDLDTKIHKFYQRHYININRDKFDRWMVSMIPKRVEKRFGVLYKNYKVKEDYIEVIYECDGAIEKVKTRKIIGADGSMSRVRRQFSPKKNLPKEYISIQKVYQNHKQMPFYISVFDQKITDFYSWGIQKKDELLVGTAIPPNKDPHKAFKELEETLTDYGFDLSKKLRSSGTLIFRPLRLNSIEFGNHNIHFVGEAAGLISPSSAEGISYALKSSLYLAKAINKSEKSSHLLYKKNAIKFYMNILIKNIKVKIMYQPFLRKLIMKSGILSMDIEIND